MKKFICCVITSILGVSLLCGCNPSLNSGSTGEDQTPPKTMEEQLQEIDKGYDRVIYINENAVYNLKQQYKYEKISTVNATVETTATSFTMEDFIITTASCKDITSEEATVKFSDNKTEKVMVHVVNRQKYGARLNTVDAGYLYGKRVMFFGDSITHNWAKYPNGDYQETPSSDSLGYNHVPMLNEVCHFSSIVNTAWSGGTMAYLPTSDERFVYKSFPGAVSDHKEDIKNAEVIFVWYGTNDLWEQVPIGNPDDVMVADGKTDQNFYSGLNYGMTEIYNQNPDVDVIIMNIMVRDPSNFGSIKLSNYNEALALGANRYNARLLNTFKLFTTKDLASCFGDGLHPNETGYQRITEFILKTNKTVKK